MRHASEENNGKVMNGVYSFNVSTAPVQIIKLIRRHVSNLHSLTGKAICMFKVENTNP